MQGLCGLAAFLLNMTFVYSIHEPDNLMEGTSLNASYFMKL